MEKLIERVKKLEQVKKDWKAFCDIVGQGDCDKENELIAKIDGALMFKDKQEKEHWLDVLSSYKFWEDFEELTQSIIDREKEQLETLADKFYDVFEELAKMVDFKTLFNAFMVATDWVAPISDFEKWWESDFMNKEEKAEFINVYKEIYEKDFDIKEIKDKYYGFELSCFPNFYEDNENDNGKGVLIDCIFDRYLDNYEYDNLPFYIVMINELMNSELFTLLRTWKKAIKDFNEDIENDNSTKGSLDQLEDCHADVYEYIEHNFDNYKEKYYGK